MDMVIAVTSDTGLLLLSVAGLAATASAIVRDTKRRLAPSAVLATPAPARRRRRVGRVGQMNQVSQVSQAS